MPSVSKRDLPHAGTVLSHESVDCSDLRYVLSGLKLGGLVAVPLFLVYATAIIVLDGEGLSPLSALSFWEIGAIGPGLMLIASTLGILFSGTSRLELDGELATVIITGKKSSFSPDRIIGPVRMLRFLGLAQVNYRDPKSRRAHAVLSLDQARAIQLWLERSQLELDGS